MNTTFVDDYILSNTELERINIPRPSKYFVKSKKWDNLSSILLNKIGLNNNYKVGVDTCATNIIHNLFQRYMVLKDTIIITTNSEHSSVMQQFNDGKYEGTRDNIHYGITSFISDAYKVHIFDIDNVETINNIKNNIENSKLILLYTKGCNSQTGKIYSDEYLKNIKKCIIDINPTVQVMHCIDDVQSLFLIKRDYTNYNYIISTAHAIISNYDTGLIIYNDNNNDFGYQILPFIEEYIKKWSIIENIVDNTKYIKSEVINKIMPYLPEGSVLNQENEGYNSNIINIEIPKKYYTPSLQKIKNKMLSDYRIKLEGYGFDHELAEKIYIRVRITEMLCNKVNIHETIANLIKILRFFSYNI